MAIQTKRFKYAQDGKQFTVTCLKTRKSYSFECRSYVSPDLREHVATMMMKALSTVQGRTYAQKAFFNEVMSENELKAELENITQDITEEPLVEEIVQGISEVEVVTQGTSEQEDVGVIAGAMSMEAQFDLFGFDVAQDVGCRSG